MTCIQSATLIISLFIVDPFFELLVPAFELCSRDIRYPLLFYCANEEEREQWICEFNEYIGLVDGDGIGFVLYLDHEC